MTVVELWPGGGYWTEILGPYLAPQGHYYVALQAPGDRGRRGYRQMAPACRSAGRAASAPSTETKLGPGQFDIAPAGSADMVLTFRNLHNWMNGGYAEQALAACFKALKPGGIFGIEEHRGSNDTAAGPEGQERLRAPGLRHRAGAKRQASSWSAHRRSMPIPRTPRTGRTASGRCRRRCLRAIRIAISYLAIGEADNFVLKFQKPAH